MRQTGQAGFGFPLQVAAKTERMFLPFIIVRIGENTNWGEGIRYWVLGIGGSVKCERMGVDFEIKIVLNSPFFFKIDGVTVLRERENCR